MYAFLGFVFLAIAILFVDYLINNQKFGFRLIIVLIALYWGVTYLDTVDMPGYVDLYSQLIKGVAPHNVLWGLSYYSFEPAFLYLMQLFKDFGCPFFVFKTCLLTFEVVLVGIGLKRLLNDYRMTTVFLVAISLFPSFWLMAAMRQGIPIAVFIYVMPDIIKGKYIKPILLILVSSLFHSSGVFLIILILFYLVYKKFVIDVDFSFNLVIIYTAILLFCDVVYLLGISLADFMDKITMALFSDNPFIYRDYTIMSNSDDSNYGIMKFAEMNLIYFMTFYFHPQRKAEKSYYFLEALFLIFFVFNTAAGGIIIHRLSYFLTIPYYLLFYKELHRIAIRLKLPGFDTVLFILYMFFLFIRQYHPFTSYVFEYFSA